MRPTSHGESSNQISFRHDSTEHAASRAQGTGPILKKTFGGTRAHLTAQPPTFDHRNIACLRTAFNFQMSTHITLEVVKRRYQERCRKFHADKLTGQPARVKHLARRVLYALDFLCESMRQEGWDQQHRNVNDRPVPTDYPEYHSEEFANAASTTTEEVHLQYLTQPDPPQDRGAENDAPR